ncbi:MAG TPA: NRDE family protein [Trebonia sp.]
MCTVVLSFQPSDPVPFLLLGVRDEFTDRPWRPPARHWAGSSLIGGIDEQAGGTWLAVHPEQSRVSCLLNGRGQQAATAGRHSRGELPLRAAAEGPEILKELADDPGALAAYDPFHLLCADIASALLLSWDGSAATFRDLAPGTHMLTNAGHSYPAAEPASAEPGSTGPDSTGPDSTESSGITEPKAAYFAPKFAAAARPPGDPGLPLAQAWGEWLVLADGDGLPPDDPRAIVAGRPHPNGRRWGSTSQTLVALGGPGLRYDFRALGARPAAGTAPPAPEDWHEVRI